MEFKVKYFYLKICDNRIKTHLQTPESVIQYIKDDFDYNESMLLIGMNIKNRVVIKKTIAMGGYNTLCTVPADIFIPLLKLNARSFIIVHNHPSNDTTPSQEDIIFTKKVDKASTIIGLNLLDHIIINADNKDYYSFKKNQLI